jgi:hypothetical protein
LDLQKRIHGFEPGKVPLKDSSTGWTILGIKEIDLNGRRRLLGHAVKGKRKQNESTNGKDELPYSTPFRLSHASKPPNRLFTISDLLKY